MSHTLRGTATRRIRNTFVLLAAACALVLTTPTASYADALKDDAVQRLARSHDPEISIAIGRLYVKQAALRAARARLARQGAAAGLGRNWSPASPEWVAAEQALMARVPPIVATRLDDPEWFHAAWAKEADRLLNAEEADELANHFATPGGREQRVTIELLMVGETVMANYTMTDRIQYTMADTRAEIEHLQSVWWNRDPFAVRDFSKDPGTMRFATSNPGIKYAKMLAMRGVGSVIDHLDTVAKVAVAAVEADAPEVDSLIASVPRR